jgi:hypothetical protein
MIRVLLILVAALFAGVVTSCSQDEVITTNDEVSFLADIMAAPQPALDEFKSFAEGAGLKSASVYSSSVVMVFPLDRRTVEVFDVTVKKYFILYEFGQGGQRNKEITISQIFEILPNGKIDPTSGKFLEATPGCSQKRHFYIDDQYITGIHCFCNFKDGRQFGYVGQITNNTVQLPPLEGGVWQLSVDFNDGDIPQKFSTLPINNYAESNVIELKTTFELDNIVAYVEIEKKYLEGAELVQVYSFNSMTDEVDSYIDFKVLYDELLPKFVLYGVPFGNIYRINIYGKNGNWSFIIAPSLGAPINGKPVYSLEHDEAKG